MLALVLEDMQALGLTGSAQSARGLVSQEELRATVNAKAGALVPLPLLALARWVNPF